MACKHREGGKGRCRSDLRKEGKRGKEVSLTGEREGKEGVVGKEGNGGGE